jgi:hypothetical protein
LHEFSNYPLKADVNLSAEHHVDQQSAAIGWKIVLARLAWPLDDVMFILA